MSRSNIGLLFVLFVVLAVTAAPAQAGVRWVRIGVGGMA